MLDFETIKKRLTSIFQIGLGQYDKLTELDLSRRGFFLSFQTLIFALLPLLVDIAISAKLGDMNRPLIEIIFGRTLISFTSWFAPLIIIFILANILQFNNKLIVFTIAYNWLQLAVSLCYVPFYIIILLVPDLIAAFSSLLFFMTIFLIYISFRVFDAVLQEKFAFTLAFFLLYFLASTLAEFTCFQLLGWA